MKKIVFLVFAAALLVVSKAPLVSAQTGSTDGVILLGGSDYRTNRNDVWRSSGDLQKWNQVLPEAPDKLNNTTAVITPPLNQFPGRSAGTFSAYLNGKIYRLDSDVPASGTSCLDGSVADPEHGPNGLANGSIKKRLVNNQPIPCTQENVFSFERSIWTSSDNGMTWTRIAFAPYNSRLTPSLLSFNNKLWVIGGSNAGAAFDTDHGDARDVWSSPDGITWTQIAKKVPELQAAVSSNTVVFQNKIWVFTNNTAASSSDGITWTDQTFNAQLGQVNNGTLEDGKPANWMSVTVLVFQNKLWIFGRYFPSVTAETPSLAGVWSSLDGVNWTLVNSNAAFGPVIGMAPLSYGGKMWLFGGAKLPGKITNEIWSSTDGVTWVKNETPAWSLRMFPSLVVVPNSQIMKPLVTVNSSISKTLSLGQSDSQVTVLQNYLIAHGYLSGTATGYYGAKTKLGVLAFQKKFGIAGGDGTTFGAKSRAVMSVNN